MIGDKAICTAVVLGHNHYEKYTLPLVKSLQKYEPDLPIVIVDNDSDPPYPRTPGAWSVWANNESVAKGRNAGMSEARNTWYLTLDNDVICTGSFLDIVKTFRTNKIYGPLMKDWEVFSYLPGWAVFFSDMCWSAVGEWDEEFKPWGYTEVDYFYRANQLGFEQVHIKELPFNHYAHGSHEFIPPIDILRERNQAMFKAKHGL